MLLDLGHTIHKICQITPGGVLVFFPSYGLLEACYDHWQKQKILTRIFDLKAVFKEPKDPKEY
jgi:Rad3-related DNA helicase